MAKRLTMVLVALFVLGFAVAGCGDDETTATTPPATTAAPAATPAPATTETEPETGGAPAASSGIPDTPEAKQAIEACKAQAAANLQLLAEAKEKLGEVCEEAGSGDADGAVKATLGGLRDPRRGNRAGRSGQAGPRCSPASSRPSRRRPGIRASVASKHQSSVFPRSWRPTFP